ncbi:MAG: hypothetical protein LWY06_00980 [Firmicutes bacterium]|nr:hypothetical protein [Bacillota bacterium]
MSDNYSIGAIRGSSLKRNEQVQASSMEGIKPGFQTQQNSQASPVQAQRGDSISFSDEVKEPGNNEGVNLDALKGEIAGIKNQLNVQPSGNDASGGLVNDAMSVQMERNGLGAVNKPQEQTLGFTPGMQGGGAIGAEGIQSGFESGMKAGGAFSSRQTSEVGHEAGGGLTTPKMAKLQTNYADALKSGHSVNSGAENMVLNTFADSGKNADPIKAMLGMEKAAA